MQHGAPAFLAGINDVGEITGWGVFPSSPFEAFICLDDCYSFSQAINFKSQVVGSALSCDRTVSSAFLWELGSIVDLNTLIPSDSSLQLNVATDINDRGEIVGDGVPPGASANTFADRSPAMRASAEYTITIFP
jgi:probable HAF family extracellular repeat protein